MMEEVLFSRHHNRVKQYQQHQQQQQRDRPAKNDKSYYLTNSSRAFSRVQQPITTTFLSSISLSLSSLLHTDASQDVEQRHPRGSPPGDPGQARRVSRLSRPLLPLSPPQYIPVPRTCGLTEIHPFKGGQGPMLKSLELVLVRHPHQTAE